MSERPCNVCEWNDLKGAAGSSRGIRGGSWFDFEFYSSSSIRATNAPSDENDGHGFRLAGPVAVPEPSNLAAGEGGAGVTAAHPVRPDRFEASSSSRRWKAYGIYTSRK